MKYIIVILIKAYWAILPAQKRRRCIFKLSCSKYVYQKTISEGFIAGLKAFKFRFQNCRSGAQLIENPLTRELQIVLPNQQIINEQEISTRFLK